MENGLPFVSIVIVSYNAETFLKDCYDSIRNLNYPRDKVEVILADNASADNTVAFTKNNYPWVRILTLDKNYGFAEGNNRGAEITKGEYIVFLNQDVKVEPNWLIDIVNTAKSDEKIGICGSLIKDFYKPKLIQSAENYIDFFGNITHKDQGSEESEQFKNPANVFFVSGVSLLIKRDVLKQLKYCFDSTFFMYFEEVDLCWRVNLLGYKVVFVPTSVVYHKGNMDPEKVKPANILRMTQNRILSFRKNLDFPLKQIFLVFVLLRSFLSIVYWSYKGKWDSGLSFLSALITPINRDLDMSKVSIARQLNVFSTPSIRTYLSFFKLSKKFKNE